MAWGISIWGINTWGGGPSSENLSYEIPDGAGDKGEADQWDVASASAQEMIAAFEATGGTWDPWEDFEEQWRLAFLVHAVPDTVNVLVSPYPATTQPMAIAIANELAAKYPTHLRLIDQSASIENGTNEPWVISDGATLTLKVNRGAEQTVTLTGLTPGAATAEQVAQSINLQLFDGRATVTSSGNRVTIKTIHRGMTKFLEITGGTANPAMVFSTTEQVGTDNVHLEEDTANPVVFSPNPATDYFTLALVVSAIRQAYNEHVWEHPDVHRKWDKDNIVISPDVSLDPPNPADLPQLLTLVNELYADYNAHLATTGYDEYNESALFAFLDSHLTPAIFDPNLGSEGLEQSWSITDQFPDLYDQRGVVSVDGYIGIIVEVTAIPGDGAQFVISFAEFEPPVVAFEFDTNAVWTAGYTQVDISAAATLEDVRDAMEPAINNAFFPGPVFGKAATPLGSTQLLIIYPTPDFPAVNTRDLEPGTFNTEPTGGTPSNEQLAVGLYGPTWPDGHEELLSVFEYINGRIGIRETFEMAWLLPGSLAGLPNDVFLSRYLQSSGEWAFRDGQLAEGVLEDFEAGWKDNDVGAAAYLAGSTWRFLDTQIKTMALGEYTFGWYDKGTGDENIAAALPAPHYSPDLAMHVVTALTAYAQIWTEFYDKDGVAQSCYWHLEDGSWAVDSVINEIGLTSILADPRYEFEDQFNGIKQMKDWAVLFSTPVGKVELRGTKYVAETFEEGWVLTLS